jgi:hypothetical protein
VSYRAATRYTLELPGAGQPTRKGAPRQESDGGQRAPRPHQAHR